MDMFLRSPLDKRDLVLLDSETLLICSGKKGAKNSK